MSALELNTRSTLQRVSGNAIWSLLRYASSWVTLLVVPPLLARRMSPGAYATWMLLLQCGTYVSFFDSSMQTSISRFVGRAVGLEDRKYLKQVLASVLMLLLAGSCITFLCTALVAAGLPRLFPGIPLELVPAARKGLLIIGCSLALALPFTTLVGGFLGLQQNRAVTTSIVVAKLVSSIGMAWTGLHHGSIAQLACWFAAGILTQPVSYVLQWFPQRDALPVQPASATRAMLREFSGFYALFAINTLASILITGLDLPVAARYDFASVGAYSLATIFGNMLLIPQGALIGVTMPVVAGLGATRSAIDVGYALEKLARYTSLSLYGLTSALTLGAPLFLHFWLGPSMAPQVAPFVFLLLAGQVLNMAVEPYQVTVLATGRQIKLLPAWVLSALTNLACSILLAQHIGARGVALGTVAGSFVGFLAQIGFTLPRTDTITLQRRRYMRSTLLEPAIALLPAALFFLILWRYHWDIRLSAIFALLGFFTTTGILFLRTFRGAQRDELLSVLRIRRRASTISS